MNILPAAEDLYHSHFLDPRFYHNGSLHGFKIPILSLQTGSWQTYYLWGQIVNIFRLVGEEGKSKLLYSLLI